MIKKIAVLFIIIIIASSLPEVSSHLPIASQRPAVSVRPGMNVAPSIPGSNVVFSQMSQIGTIDIGNHSSALAIDNQTHLMYVALTSANVSVVNLTTNKVQKSITIPSEANEVTYNPINHYIYAQNGQSSSMTLIDTTNDSVSTMSLGAYQFASVYDPENNLVYVTNSGSYVIGINLTNSVVAKIPVPSQCGITYDPYNGFLYETGYNNYVYVLNPGNNSLVKTIQVGTTSRRAAFDPINNDIYVTNSGSNSVSVISSQNNTVVGNFNVGSGPVGIQYDPAAGAMIVENYNVNTISILNASETQGGTVESLTSGSYPWEGAVDIPSGILYVCSDGSNSIFLYSGPVYYLNFSETGLPSGATWSVDIAGDIVSSSNTTVQFTLPNGTYTYTVASSNKIYAPSPAYGSFTISGASVNETVMFQQIFAVSFLESGLPSGTVWYANVTNATQVTWNLFGTGILSLNLPNGSYSYKASSSDKNYESTEHSGTFVVGGAAFTIPVAFVVILFNISFRENGLPQGISWYVNITGQQSSGPLTEATYAVELANSSYTYSVASSNKIYAPSPYTGSFTVNGASVSESVTFSTVTYTATFTESGLPSGTTWYVNSTSFNSGPVSGSPYTVKLTNGSYLYTVASSNKTYEPSLNSRTLVVNGNSANYTIKFEIVQYTVTFTEAGLPAGAKWYVNLSNGTDFTSVSISTIFSLPNGTYSYAVGTSSANYSPTIYAGRFTISGSDVSQAISFNQLAYSITFTEIGLPSGTTWYLNLSSGQSLSSNGSSITVTLASGQFNYTASALGYMKKTGSLSVSRAPISVNIHFQHATDHTLVYVLIGIIVAVSATGIGIAVWYRRR